MTKMATTPIYGKNFKNLLLQNQKAHDLGTWYVALGFWAYQVCSNDDPRLTLTYLTSRSKLPNSAGSNSYMSHRKCVRSTQRITAVFW